MANLAFKITYEGDERPRVRVTRDDIEQYFLYDTRAQPTCMPFKVFKPIYGMVNCKRLPGKDLHIKDARGNDLGYKGTYLPFTNADAWKKSNA
jgi:hypothetical protein